MHYKEQSRELHPKPKFLVVTEAYLSATFGQKIQISLIYAFFGYP
jgi:hypothetical protein